MSWLTQTLKPNEKETLDRLIDNTIYQLSLGVNSHGLDQEYAKHILKYNLDLILTKCKDDWFDWLEENNEKTT